MKKNYETMMISVITLSNEDVLTISLSGHAADYERLNLTEKGILFICYLSANQATLDLTSSVFPYNACYCKLYI